MKKQLIIVPLTALLLCGCMGGGKGGKKKSTSGGSDTTSSTTEPEWTGKTNKDFEKAKTTYTKDNVEYQLNRNTLYKNQSAPHLDPMSTESHVLVVPFGFTDYTSVQTEANRQRIKETFFSTQSEIEALGGWQSLASFYNKSSYGNTVFGGEILPTWCVYNGTSSQFASSASGYGGPKAAEYARSWYISEYGKDGHGELGENAKPISYFDADNDGYLDLVWVVYSAPTVQGTDWWAYVTYTNNSPSMTNPNVKTLGWASYDWMDNGLNGHDSHTFIHETGHTLGLDDYYDYNNKWAPMGGIDFMDHNLGDHAMYSKFSLGWTAPLIVDDDAMITLHPGTTTGDCFILPSPNYNKTAFDEYMMLELMAPVGLAERDYKNGYDYTKGYDKPGIRITHVDARAYAAGKHDVPLTDHPEEGIDVRLDNSFMGRSSLKADSDYFPRGEDKFSMPQFSIMESFVDKNNNWTKSKTYTASNNSLFTKGASFNLKPESSWAKTFMPSGTNLWNKAKTITGWVSADTQTYEIDYECTFNYSVKVVSIEKSDEFGYEAKVQVTKNAY